VTWTRLSDTFPDRPDLLRVDRSARLLHVEALIWCNRQTTDGELPRGALRRLGDSENVAREAAELVAAGVWAETETGWRLDWDAEDQLPSSEVRAAREAAAARQRRFRKHGRGDHSECTTRCPHVTRDGTGDGTRDETPSRPGSPFPSSPGPEGQGTGGIREADTCPHGAPSSARCALCRRGIEADESAA
jgi:hypothetical protein